MIAGTGNVGAIPTPQGKIDHVRDLKALSRPHAHRTATQVESDTDFGRLADHIDGSPWSVTYYNQVKAEDDIVSPLDHELPDSVSQYISIEDLIFHVDSPLDSSVDTTGTAKVLHIVPSEGDLFVATVPSGRSALLTIDSVKQLSYALEPVFEITYKVDSFLDSDSVRYKDLLTKVVREYVYSTEYSDTPLVMKKDMLFIQSTKTVDDTYTSMFLDVALKDNASYLTRPDGLVDILLEDFFFAIVDSPILINTITRTPIRVNSSTSFYRAILAKNRSLFDMLPRTPKTYKDGSMASSIRGVLNTDKGGIIGFGMVSSEQYVKRTVDEETKVISYAVGAADDAALLPVDPDNLFDNPIGTSIIEELTVALMEGKVLDKQKFQYLYSSVYKWSDMEKYYYIPVLLVLSKYFRHTASSNSIYSIRR